MSLTETQMSTWASGLFEVCGSLYFNREKSTPKIELRDNDPKRILRSQELLGGNVYKNNSTWVLTGNAAVDLVQMMKPTSPRRSRMIDAFLGWGELATKVTQQEFIHNELESFSTQAEMAKAPVTESDYFKLILDRAFLGGVIDARATFHRAQRKDAKASPIMTLATENVALLNALVTRYGGSGYFERATEYGKTSQIALKTDKLLQIISKVSPYILLRDYSVLFDEGTEPRV